MLVSDGFRIGDTVEPTPTAPPMQLKIGQVGRVLSTTHHDLYSVNVRFEHGTAAYEPRCLQHAPQFCRVCDKPARLGDIHIGRCRWEHLDGSLVCPATDYRASTRGVLS